MSRHTAQQGWQRAEGQLQAIQSLSERGEWKMNRLG